MTKHTRIRTTGWIAAAGLFAVALAAPATTLATKPAPEHKVTICHRTDSQTNPYVRITVDVASVDGDNGNDKGKGDHLMEHTGDVWFPGHAKAPKWGDIIPPFYTDGVETGMPSLNWNAAGQELWNNGCKPAETTTTTTTSETTQETTTVETTTVETTTDETTVETTTAETTDETTVETTTDQTTTDETTAETTDQTTTDQTTTDETTNTPEGTVLAETGSPDSPTAPATDALSTDNSQTASNGSWSLLLAAGALLIVATLVLTPATRRNRR